MSSVATVFENARVAATAAILFSLVLAQGCTSQTLEPKSQTSFAGSPEIPQLTSSVARVNYYRKLERLPGITANASLNDAAAQHARYVLENNLSPVDFSLQQGRLKQYRPGKEVHKEEPANAWYTHQGANVAGRCYVFETKTIPGDGALIVDQFMTTPFMILNTLDPGGSALGYGSSCSSNRCIVVTPVDEWWPEFKVYSYFVPDTSRPKVDAVGNKLGRMWFKLPLEYPAPDGQTTLRTLGDFSYLDALTSCSGYQQPAGLPVLLSLGYGPRSDDAVHLSAHSISDGGKEVESCAFDTSNYTNPDPDQEKLMRQWLLRTLAVVLIPREPLKPGHKYDVSMTVDSKDYSWSFKVAGDGTQK